MDKKNRLFEKFQKYGVADPRDNLEAVLELPREIGSGYRREISLRPGLKLYLENYCLKEKMTAKVEAEHYPFGISVCISGKLNWIANSPDNRQTFFTRAGEFDFSFSDSSNGFIECLPDEKIMMISILIQPDLMWQLVDNRSHCLPPDFLSFINDPADQFSYHKERTCPFMQMAAHQLMNCRFQGAAKKLYLESKTMELFALLLARFERKEARDKVRLGASDRDKLHLVKRILAHDIANPPSLGELAGRAGLNETKLKKGFKSLFGTTAFGYLTDLRMEKGRVLLATGDMNVTEVAYEVGYANRAHFSRAFTRHFGCPPVSFLQAARK